MGTVIEEGLWSFGKMLAQEGVGICKQWSSRLADGEERVAIQHEGNSSETHPWMGIAPAVAKGDIKMHRKA